MKREQVPSNALSMVWHGFKLGDPKPFQHPKDMTQVESPYSITVRKVFTPFDNTLISKAKCDGILLVSCSKSKVMKQVSFSLIVPMCWGAYSMLGNSAVN